MSSDNGWEDDRDSRMNSDDRMEDSHGNSTSSDIGNDTKHCPATGETPPFFHHKMVPYELDSRGPRHFYGVDTHDVCLIAGDVEFQVHKAFLVVHSTYFKDRFAADSDKVDEKRVEVDADPTYLNAVLEVVYKGKQDDLTYLRLKCNEERSARAFWTHAEGLWKVIDDFDFHHVREHFRRKIEKNACDTKQKPSKVAYEDWRPTCSYGFNLYLFARLHKLPMKHKDSVSISSDALRAWLAECSKFLPESVAISGELFQGVIEVFRICAERNQRNPSPESERSDRSRSPEEERPGSPEAKIQKIEEKEKLVVSRSYLCPDLSDVSLIVGGVKFHVHKMLMAAHSPFFRVLFFGDFVEKNKKEITIDADPDTFHTLMQITYGILSQKDYFNYDHVVSNPPRDPLVFEKAQALWTLIDRFDLPYVKEYLEREMTANLHVQRGDFLTCTSCITHVVFGQLHGFKVISDSCLIFPHAFENWLGLDSRFLPGEVRVSGAAFQEIIAQTHDYRDEVDGHRPDCECCDCKKDERSAGGGGNLSKAQLPISHWYLDSSLSNVCILVGGVEFNVHRMVLALHSGHFREMFFPGSFENEHLKQLEIEADPILFHAVMEIVHNGRLSDIGFLKCKGRDRKRSEFWFMAEGLWQLADRFDISCVKEWLRARIFQYACPLRSDNIVRCSFCVSDHVFAALHGIKFSEEEDPRFRKDCFADWMVAFSRFLPASLPLTGTVLQKILRKRIIR